MWAPLGSKGCHGVTGLPSYLCRGYNQSGQIGIILKPELRGFGGDSLPKPPFKVTSAEVVIICPDQFTKSLTSGGSTILGLPTSTFNPSLIHLTRAERMGNLK